MTLQAGALLGDALALCGELRLGVGGGLGGGLGVLQRGDLVVQSAVGLVECGALQGADGRGVALQLQQLTLQAGAFLGDAVALGGELRLGVGGGLGGGLGVLQRGDLVVQRLVAFVECGALQGADGSGVALQLQQLAF